MPKLRHCRPILVLTRYIDKHKDTFLHYIPLLLDLLTVSVSTFIGQLIILMILPSSHLQISNKETHQCNHSKYMTDPRTRNDKTMKKLSRYCNMHTSTPTDQHLISQQIDLSLRTQEIKSFNFTFIYSVKRQGDQQSSADSSMGTPAEPGASW